ncbi:MAG: HEAT repeat domain-containing protein [Sandaracinaceae bacterium]
MTLRHHSSPRALRASALGIVAVLAALAACALSPSDAGAQRGRRRPAAASEEGAEPSGPQPTVRDIDTIAARLQSQNPDEVREAIDLLSVIDHPSVVPHLASLLRSGRSDEVTDRALLALRGLAHPSAIEVLTEFTHHRRARARRLAYQALAAIQDRRVPALLEHGLSDSDRSVRAQCARSLGEIGASGSVDTLVLAFDRGVVEAAISIGKLGNRAAIGRFNEHLGHMPLSVMLSGYNEFVRRSDIPDEAKIDIVGRLGDISGDMVRVFLQRYLDTFSMGRAAQRDRVRQVVIETLRRIPGHAGSARGRTVSTDSADAAGGDQ